ncbi:hypothetical protein KCU93_g510, partial [Aureobasidium melanogenum]
LAKTVPPRISQVIYRIANVSLSAGVDLSGWVTYDQCQGHCSRIDTIPRHMPTWLRNVVVCIPRQEYRSTSIRAGVSFGAAYITIEYIYAKATARAHGISELTLRSRLASITNRRTAY